MNARLEKLYRSMCSKAKENPYVCAFTAVFLVIFIPFLIRAAYYIGENWFCIIHTEIELKDALSNYYTLLSALGTISLGLIAVAQNNRLHSLEESVNQKECSSNIFISGCAKMSPALPLLSHDGKDQYEKSNVTLFLNIKNYSNAFLSEITIKFGENLFHSNISLAKEMAKDYRIILPINCCENNEKCDVEFISCYGVKTYGDFQLSVSDSTAHPKYYHFYGVQKK